MLVAPINEGLRLYTHLVGDFICYTGKEVENQLVVDYSNKKRVFIVHANGYKTKRVTEFDTSQPNNFRWKVTLERESQ